MVMFKCPHCGKTIELQIVGAMEPPRPTEKQPIEPADNIRAALNRMDDVELGQFVMLNFSRVYDRFSYGMRRDEKINLLLDYHRREEDDYAQLKFALRQAGKMR